MSAFGSAMLTSPSMPRLADTPPVVGSVSTETNGRRASPSRASAALVLAICMSASTPSCMRAPPLAAKQTMPARCSMAASTPRTKRSPTTEPMEPSRKRDSKAAVTTGTPLTRPCITTRASFSPVAF